MTDLARLTDEARRLVSEELMRGQIARPRLDQIVALVEPAGRPLDLGPFEESVDAVIRSTERFDPAIDARAAPAIHRSLPLTRREAADPGIWRYLAVVVRPELVRHRWEYRTRATMATRFWTFGTRHDSNTLCRLWWIAELTRDGEDYGLTERVLASPSMAVTLFVRDLSAYRPAVEAFATVFADTSAELMEQAMKRFSAWLSTVPLEGRTTEELSRALGEIRSALERRARAGERADPS